MKMKTKNSLNRKKRTYTAKSSALIALVLAFAVVMNVAVFALGQHFRWYIDMSKGQVYSLSNETKDILRDTKEDVDIYFTVEADKIASASPYLYYVYQTALELEKNFDFVSVHCIDIVKNPGFFKPYYNSAAQDIKTTSVLVTSGTEFRLFTIDAFFITNEKNEIWAYQGEYKFASAILSMTAAEMPVVCFTTAHGEKTGDSAKALTSLFEDAGYSVVDVDLAKDDIPDDTRIVIVNDPVYDFAGIESGSETNEIDKLDAFLDGYGCLMVFASPSHASELKNLSELLYEWGIEFTPDSYVKDGANSVSVDQKSIVAAYETEGLGSSLYLDISKLGSMPKTIVQNAMPLKLLWERADNLDGVREVSPVLSAHDGAVAVGANGEETDASGAPLMILSRETRVENNEYMYSYVLACGSADYNNSEYLNAKSYANRDILYSAMRITGRERVLADIEPKVLDDTSIDITTAQANNWTVALATVLPVVIIACGAVVWVRRKNS